jgi:hypothetical protein
MALAMTDLHWAAARNGCGNRLINRWYLNGRRGAGLMMTIWPLMTLRRQNQIETALMRWKSAAKVGCPASVETCHGR